MKTTPLLLTEFGGAASADVDAPADEVFAAVTDVARLPEWNARLGSVHPGSSAGSRVAHPLCLNEDVSRQLTTLAP